MVLRVRDADGDEHTVSLGEAQVCMKRVPRLEEVLGEDGVPVDIALVEAFFPAAGNAAQPGPVAQAPALGADEYHTFLSHKESEGIDAIGVLHDGLEKDGVRSWYSQAQEVLDQPTMRAGVSVVSKTYLLFLTKNVFESFARSAVGLGGEQACDHGVRV